MKNLIALIRFCGVIASMVFMLLAILLIMPLSTKLLRTHVRVLWSKMLIAASGAKLNITGYPLAASELKNAMIVANHISWLDTVVLYRLCFLQFIGKIEMLNWPILRSVIKAGGTIFIDRSKKRDLINVNQQIASLLHQGAVIGLFPEGTTSKGHQVLPFKAPLLEAARMAHSTIYPVVLSYRKQNNQLASEVSFAKVGWLTTVMNTLRLNQFTITVTVLPPVAAANFSNREQLANVLHQQISQEYTINNNLPNRQGQSYENFGY